MYLLLLKESPDVNSYGGLTVQMWVGYTSMNEINQHRRKSNRKAENVPVALFERRRLDFLEINLFLHCLDKVTSSLSLELAVIQLSFWHNKEKF